MLTLLQSSEMKLTRNGDSSVLEPLQSQWSRGGAPTADAPGGELARPEVSVDE